MFDPPPQPGRNTEAHFARLLKRVRDLERRAGRGGAARVLVTPGTTGGGSSSDAVQIGHALITSRLDADGHTVIVEARNLLTNGPSVTIATLP